MVGRAKRKKIKYSIINKTRIKKTSIAKTEIVGMIETLL